MWNNKIEQVCINLSSKCQYYKDLHDEATSFYYKLDNWLSIINIFILTATGTASFATLNVSDDLYIKIIIGIIIYISAVLDSIKKFVNPSEKNILHSNATKQYSNLYHNIQKQLILELEQRQSGKDYIGWITREFDNLQSNAPDIPSIITKNKNEPKDIPLKEIVTELEIQPSSNQPQQSKDMEHVKDAYSISRFMEISS